MGVLLKFVEEYPPNKPKKYDELKEWKLKLNQIGSSAIHGAIQVIGTKDDKITCTRFYDMRGSDEIKKRTWPQNMPHDVIEFYVGKGK